MDNMDIMENIMDIMDNIMDTMDNTMDTNVYNETHCIYYYYLSCLN